MQPFYKIFSSIFWFSINSVRSIKMNIKASFKRTEVQNIKTSFYTENFVLMQKKLTKYFPGNPGRNTVHYSKELHNLIITKVIQLITFMFVIGENPKILIFRLMSQTNNIATRVSQWFNLHWAILIVQLVSEINPSNQIAKVIVLYT